MIWSNGIIVSKFSRFTAQQLCKNYCPFQSLAISFLWTKFLYFATKAGSWGIPIKLSQLYEGPWGRLMARSWHLRIIGERDLHFGWNLNFCRHKEQMMHEQHYRLQVASITRASRTSQGEGWSQTLLWEQAGIYENKQQNKAIFNKTHKCILFISISDYEKKPRSIGIWTKWAEQSIQLGLHQRRLYFTATKLHVNLPDLVMKTSWDLWEQAHG